MNPTTTPGAHSCFPTLADRWPVSAYENVTTIFSSKNFSSRDLFTKAILDEKNRCRKYCIISQFTKMNVGRWLNFLSVVGYPRCELCPTMFLACFKKSLATLTVVVVKPCLLWLVHQTWFNQFAAHGYIREWFELKYCLHRELQDSMRLWTDFHNYECSFHNILLKRKCVREDGSAAGNVIKTYVTCFFNVTTYACVLSDTYSL